MSKTYTPVEFAPVAAVDLQGLGQRRLGTGYGVGSDIQAEFRQRITEATQQLVNYYAKTPLQDIVVAMRERILTLFENACIDFSVQQRQVVPVGEERDGVFAGKIQGKATCSLISNVNPYPPSVVAELRQFGSIIFARRLEEFRVLFVENLDENMRALEVRIAQSARLLAEKKEHLSALYGDKFSGDPAQLRCEREELEQRTIPRLAGSLAQEEDRLLRRRSFAAKLCEWRLCSLLERGGDAEPMKILQKFIDDFQQFLGAQQQYLTLCKLEDSVPEFNAQAFLRELFEDDVVVSTPHEAAQARADLLQEDRRLKRTKRITIVVGVSIAAVLFGGTFVARYIRNRNTQHAQDSSSPFSP